MSVNVPALRSMFPVTERWAYLNHAAVSPLSTRVQRVMSGFVDDTVDNGVVYYKKYREELDAVRRSAAQLLGADIEEIALTGNTSDGLLIVANGLLCRPGDNIVTADIEFPANVYPWKFLEQRREVEVRLVPGREGRVLMDDLAAAIDDRTRLVAISFVQFASGYRIDLGAVADLCRRHDAYLCVDAIQGLGALPMDVREAGIDFLAAGGHKWLMGPVGTGIFYVRRDLIEDLTPTHAGWLAVQDSDDYFCFDSPLQHDARRFRSGSANTPGLLGLGASIETLMEVGPENTESHLLDLTDYLIEGLRSRGMTVLTPHQTPAERSGIVCFQSATHDPETIYARMEDAGVVVAARGDRVRVAPHCYNDRDDVDRLLEALPE